MTNLEIKQKINKLNEIRAYFNSVNLDFNEDIVTLDKSIEHVDSLIEAVIYLDDDKESEFLAKYEDYISSFELFKSKVLL